jgi:Glu-tRNA(Gln) amidotransferase subunit E-like FAD-binding protein
MRNKLLLIPLLTVLLLSPTLAGAQERFPGIQELMTEQELETSGVSDLSRLQLEALNTWLIRYTANEAPVLQAENEEVIEVVRQGVTSRIVGKFSGWTGKTRFVLENGQIFEQRRPGRWKTTLDNPEVHIRQNLMGSYEMEVVSEEKSIGVRRLSR